MGRAYRSDDMEDSDDIGMESDVNDIASSEVVEMAVRRDDAAEARSVTSLCRIREQLNHDVEAYLASGGAIHPADDRPRVVHSGNASGGHRGLQSM